MKKKETVVYTKKEKRKSDLGKWSVCVHSVLRGILFFLEAVNGKSGNAFYENFKNISV